MPIVTMVMLIKPSTEEEKFPSKFIRDRVCAATHRATLVPPRTDNQADTVADNTELVASAGPHTSEAASTIGSPPP